VKRYLLLLAALAGPASAQGLALPASTWESNWTRGDTYRQSAVTALLIYDWSQTNHMAKNRCSDGAINSCGKHFGEDGLAKVWVGVHPSVGKVNNYFAASIIGHAAISYLLPRGWREGWQYVQIGISVQTVRTNYLGIKYGF
jgi:hypothetical protein